MSTLRDRLLRSFERYAGNPALDVDDKVYSYEEIGGRTRALAAHLAGHESRGGFVGIFAYRSVGAYVGIYATIVSGYAYLPMNPRFPGERAAYMLNTADCNLIVLGVEGLPLFRAVADKVEALTVFCLDRSCDLSADYPQHTFIHAAEPAAGGGAARPLGPDSPAYLMFTSGSTGNPKGVLVSHANVESYLEFFLGTHEVFESDRHSQTFDQTFDPSVHDIFVSMSAGACLCVVPAKSIITSPAKFIIDKRITIWYCVPSIALLMNKLRLVTPGVFPGLRYSMFCGEALSANLARLWQAAAPNSFVENLFGPTELTITITSFRWDDRLPEAACVNGDVPIGAINPNHEFRLVDAGLNAVADGTEGEFCVAGPQVALGYVKNPGETSARFVSLDATPRKWYRTGDLARNTERGLVFLGRIDDQVKIRGYRIELGEVDRALREGAGTDLAVSVPVSLSGSGAVDAIYAFVEDPARQPDLPKIVAHCKSRLPEYMVPAKILFIDRIPLNTNGKMDRRALRRSVEKK